VLVVAAPIVAAVLLVACDEQEIEPFPTMTPPPAGTGGVRGHMHGDLTEALLCSEKWDALSGQAPVCPGSERTATVDASENDLFLFDGLEPGDYWLIGEAPEAWFMISQVSQGGHKVTVKEGQWTDLRTFGFEKRR
jgi:hypothetical protein